MKGLRGAASCRTWRALLVVNSCNYVQYLLEFAFVRITEILMNIVNLCLAVRIASQPALAKVRWQRLLINSSVPVVRLLTTVHIIGVQGGSCSLVRQDIQRRKKAPFSSLTKKPLGDCLQGFCLLRVESGFYSGTMFVHSFNFVVFVFRRFWKSNMPQHVST